MPESITAGANGNLIITTNDSKYKTIVTDTANEKFAKYTIGEPKVNIVTAVVGDGNGAYYMPTSDMTAIKNEVWRGKIAKQEINALSKNMVDVKIILDGNVGGFTIREVGLLDEEGDLIVISNFPPTPKALILEGVPSKLVILLHTLFANVDAVQFNVDPSIDHITMEELESALEKAVQAHNEEGHPNTTLIQMEHHLGCRPQIIALAYQYGAGMGNGPAGGTNLMEIPTKVEYSGKDSLTIYTTKSAAKPDIDKILRKVSDTEYIVTYKDNDIDAVYIKLLPKLRLKNHLSHELATLHHGLGVYPQAIAGILQYGAGVAGAGIGPAGGTDIEQIPIRTVWHDNESLTLYTEEEIQPDALSEVTRVSDSEYVITYGKGIIESIYIRLLTGQSVPVVTPPSSDTDMMVSVAAQAVNAHNNSKYAHPDIRLDGGKF